MDFSGISPTKTSREGVLAGLSPTRTVHTRWRVVLWCCYLVMLKPGFGLRPACVGPDGQIAQNISESTRKLQGTEVPGAKSIT